MATQQEIHIGILSPAAADRPHFKSLQQMLPAEVTVTNEGLGLLKDSYHDLEGKTDEIAARTADFVRRNQVHGLIVTGGFVILFNPGLEAKIAEVMRIPVTSALPSVTVALNSLSVTKVMLVTPFIAEMNAYIEKHLTNLGFTVVPFRPTTRPASLAPASRLVPTSFSKELKQVIDKIRLSRAFTSRAPPSIRCRSFKGWKITSASPWSPATSQCSGTSCRS